MSATENVHDDVRTSIEVAATSQDSCNKPHLVGVLEGAGELHSPLSLPPVDLDAARSPASLPPFAAGELELSVKWGMRDYGRIAEESGGRRITRTSARAVRDGTTLPSQAMSGRYRGHREIHNLKSGSGLSPGAERRREGSLDSPTDVRRDGSRRRGSDLPRHIGSAREDLRREGRDPIDPETRRDGSDMDDLAVLKLLDLGDESSPEGHASRAAIEVSSLALVPRPSSSSKVMNWFDLCNDEDQLGQLPASWGRILHDVPTLPCVEQSEASFVDDFWREVRSSSSDMDSDEDSDWQHATNASIVTTQSKYTQRVLEPQPLEAMVVVVEVLPEQPAGTDGRYTTTQKIKSVPRSSEQRDA